jgi:hypothetical protein
MYSSPTYCPSSCSCAIPSAASLHARSDALTAVTTPAGLGTSVAEARRARHKAKGRATSAPQLFKRGPCRCAQRPHKVIKKGKPSRNEVKTTKFLRRITECRPLINATLTDSTKAARDRTPVPGGTPRAPPTETRCSLQSSPFHCTATRTHNQRPSMVRASNSAGMRVHAPPRTKTAKFKIRPSNPSHDVTTSQRPDQRDRACALSPRLSELPCPVPPRSKIN